MTPEQTAAATRAAVAGLGAAFAECPRTLRRARQLGLTGWAFSVAGRGGALGDVRSETVAAAIGVIEPDAVRDGWEAARRVLPPAQIASHYREQCCRWGREHLEFFHGVGKLVDMTERVVLAADAAGMPLFAAWREMPLPEDGPGARAAVLAHLLWEHRAGARLMASRAGGLSAVEAVLVGPDGEAGAIAAGWQPPYPPVGPLLRKCLWVDALTDRIVGQSYAALDPPERATLVQLFDAALSTAQTATGEYPTV